MQNFRTLSGASLGLLALMAVSVADARDDHKHLPISDAMSTPAAKEKLNDDIQVFWGEQPHPTPEATLGEYTANKKTNAFNKSDKEACEWVFLSAMISLQSRAKAEGGNALINVHSVYRNEEFTSTTEYECGAGAIMAGVALRGTVVKLP